MLRSWCGLARDFDGVGYAAGEMLSYERLAEVVDKVLRCEVERRERTVEMLKRGFGLWISEGMKYTMVLVEGKGVAWDKDERFTRSGECRCGASR